MDGISEELLCYSVGTKNLENLINGLFKALNLLT